jgi:hypothetical protein
MSQLFKACNLGEHPHRPSQFCDGVGKVVALGTVLHDGAVIRVEG